METTFVPSEAMEVLWSYSTVIVYALVLGVCILVIRRHSAGGVCRSRARLEGKTVIVTGANTGIGKETARDMAERGVRVILACRDVTKASRAADDIRRSTGNGNVVVQELDLASLASIRAFARRITDSESRLDILINNAGISLCPHWTTKDGFEMTFGVNHLGHFLLTNLLLDLLKKSAPSRVVCVSSKNHHDGSINFGDINWEGGYNFMKAYGQSKLANVMFARELSKRMEGSGVTAYSLHPGVILTEGGRHVKKVVGNIIVFLTPIILLGMLLFGKNVRQGAQTSIYCAVTEGLEVHSGKYFSDCEVTEPSPLAKDDDVSKRLWDLSAEMVGLE
ncbi:retinol dehydrogenase 12-like [Branchiostoma lanceolatum]|uniref:retinol dehydrogenase 12-like n=1 Tax=Branchiostoma lanceolatum TaxID=7740 RepID=UPI003452025F